MSNTNGFSNGATPAPVNDLVREGRRIQELVEKIEAMPDSGARDMLAETLETVLSFYGLGLQRILNLLDLQAPQAKKALLADPGVSGLLLIHGLHPVPLADRLQQALDKVRPYMESHGGDVELVSLEDDHARLRLRGHCETCPSSTVTLELAVRSAIEEACPDLAGFEVENHVQNPETFQHAPAAAPEWIHIAAATNLAEGGFIHVATGANPLFICKSGGQLYAYRDHCPACNLPLHLGELKDSALTCSLGHRYNVRRAGESPDDPTLHLDPLPLLESDGVVKVALVQGVSNPIHDHA